jgi:DNA repair exonuclease SbcCD nuclease subunit
MLKIIHTADNHLGAQFKSLKELGSSQRKNLLLTFQNIIDYTLQAQASLLIIAGDLFDSNYPSLKIINFVKNEFLKLAEKNIEVCLLPGTHDCLSSDSIYLKEETFQNLKNLKIFNDPQKTSFFFPLLDLTVHARPLTSNKSTDSPIKGLKPNPKSKFNVALAHGSIQVEGKSAPDDWPITLKEIENLNMDYLALGHFHSLSEFFSKIPAFYCGAPEPLGFNQTKPGYLIELTFDENLKINPVKIGKHIFRKEKIDLSRIPDLNFLEKTIENLADPNLILKIELCGVVDPSLNLSSSILRENFCDLFFHLEIEDKTSLSLHDLRLENFKNNPLTYHFLKNLKDQIEKTIDSHEKELLEKTLQIGLAELKGQKIIE